MYSKGNLDFLVPLTIAIGILSPSIAAAADLRITDLDGNIVKVRNVRIDYTSYSFMYTPDLEYRGIKNFQWKGPMHIR